MLNFTGISEFQTYLEVFMRLTPYILFALLMVITPVLPGLAQEEKPIEEWIRSAETGDIQAQGYLGASYFDNKDYENAIKWWQMAANQGHALSQYYLARMYIQGIGIPKDDNKAFDLYLLAAKQNYAEAQNIIGFLYDNGHGVKQNEKEAFHWFQKAANNGNAEAQFNLGNFYRIGRGTEVDLAKAIEWYGKSAKNGYNGAQFELGKMYLEGNGVSKNIEKSIALFQLAAKQNLPIAQNALGMIYQKGLGVEVDYQKAETWYTKSAEFGDPLGQYFLGVLYTKPELRAYDKALSWWRKAAEQGNVLSMISLGWAYEYGKGVNKNIFKSIEWHEKAENISYDPSHKRIIKSFYLRMGNNFSSEKKTGENFKQSTKMYLRALGTKEFPFKQNTLVLNKATLSIITDEAKSILNLFRGFTRIAPSIIIYINLNDSKTSTLITKLEALTTNLMINAPFFNIVIVDTNFYPKAIKELFENRLEININNPSIQIFGNGFYMSTYTNPLDINLTLIEKDIINSSNLSEDSSYIGWLTKKTREFLSKSMDSLIEKTESEINVLEDEIKNLDQDIKVLNQKNRMLLNRQDALKKTETKLKKELDQKRELGHLNREIDAINEKIKVLQEKRENLCSDKIGVSLNCK
ncbi:MAG: SEL1-like repeat protein [Bacteroidetes bacterium]|nr:SEL1-like repeat protein [Bacteroidota bacterium]